MPFVGVIRSSSQNGRVAKWQYIQSCRSNNDTDKPMTRRLVLAAALATPSVADLRRGRDTVLEAALAAVRR
jgi:hypothetical protein